MSILIGLSLPAYVTLVWGNTSQYGFTALDHQFEQPSSAVFIDFLEPSSTYYYRATATQSGYSPVTRSGSFATGQWPGSTYNAWGQAIPQWINGTVKDTNGATAPAGIVIVVSCLSNWGYYSTEGLTQSGGRYAIPVANVYWNEEALLCAVYNRPIVVQVENGDLTLWLGHWNETIVVYAAQVVNFELPVTYLAGYNVSYIDFSNAPAGYSDLDLEDGTGYENSYSYSTSVSGSIGAIGAGISNTSTSTNGISVSETIGSQNGTLCWATRSYVSGTVAYSGVSRAWSFTVAPYDEIDGNFCNQIPGFREPSSWMYPGSTVRGIYFLLSPNGTPLHNYFLKSGNTLGYHVTISATTSTTTDFSVSFSISGTLEGILPFSFQVQASWSQTVSTTTSTTLSWELGGAANQNSCYDVFGEGGSQSQNTADMVGIYWWLAPLNHICTGG